MKKLLALLLCLSLVCSLAACGRKPIGVLKGEIGEILEIGGTEYRLTFDSGVTTADKGDYLGNATDGKKGFKCYAVKNRPEGQYILCYWEWEPMVYERAAEE